MASRKDTGRSFSGNHQRSWLWGKHAVSETLTVGRWPVLEVFVTEEARAEFAELFRHRRLGNIPVHIASRDRLLELSKASDHQGMLARLGAYPYGTMGHLKYLMDQAIAAAQPLIVMCDRIQDSFNFGAILRCCDGANVSAVVVGQSGQAAMTPHVIRSSSGAANYVQVIQTDDLCMAARHIKAAGASIIAADSHAPQSMWQCDLRGFNLLILGSEASGVAADLLAMCDQRIAIPMGGHIESLNVAVASGILLYEIRRQQQNAARSQQA